MSWQGIMNDAPTAASMTSVGCANPFLLHPPTRKQILIHVYLSPVALQFGANDLQEASGSRPVQDTVIEGETEVHHVPDGNGVILRHNGPLDHSVHAQDASMGLINNGYRYNCTKDARIVHNKRATLHILHGQLVAAGTLR